MPEAVAASVKEPSQGYQLRVVQEVLLAFLCKESMHGYQLRARLQLALGPLAEVLNAGQVYVTLTRLERAGLLTSSRVGQTDRPDRKVYELTAAGTGACRGVAGGHELAEARACGVSPEARDRRGGRARRPGADRRRPAARADCRACLRAAGRAGRARRFGRRAPARGRGAQAAGGRALARSLRPTLDLHEGSLMQTDELPLRAEPVLRDARVGDAIRPGSRAGAGARSASS